MAVNNFREYQEQIAQKNANGASAGGSNSSGQSIQFFKLAPNEQVLVRFKCATMDDVPFATVHHSKFQKSFAGNKNKFAPIKCLQDNCPFCAAAGKENAHPVVDRRSFRIFLEMLVSKYDTSTNTWGAAVPMVWEKTASFGEELDTKIKSLRGGKLCDWLCTITRTGSTKDDTKYTVDLAVREIYPDSLIPHDFSAFDNLKIDKFSYYVKSAEEMQAFLDTGSFPEAPKSDNTPAPAQATPAYQQAENNPYPQQPAPQANPYQGYNNPQYGQPQPTYNPAAQQAPHQQQPQPAQSKQGSYSWNFN